MTAVGEEILVTLNDVYLFSHFKGSIEELSSELLIKVYLRLLKVFDSNYDLKSSDDQKGSSSTAVKHIIRCLRNMELFYLVGSSNKPSKLFDKKTSLRLLSALHDKITTRHGTKTAQRVRIVLKADSLARRERKKPPLDNLPAADDAFQRQDKENSESSPIQSVPDAIVTDLPIKNKVKMIPIEVARTGVLSERILKEADEGAGHPPKTEEVPALVAPKQGRQLARTPVRPQTSTDIEGSDEGGDDSSSSLPIKEEALASPALPQAKSNTAVPKIKSLKNDHPSPEHSDEISKDSPLPTNDENDIIPGRQVTENITQALRSTVTPTFEVSCRSSNVTNVRKSVAPILSGAYVMELPLTPVGTTASEDKHVIPSGRQIARTPVSVKGGDNPSLEDSAVTPVITNEVSDALGPENIESLCVSPADINMSLKYNSKPDSNELWLKNSDNSSVEDSNAVTRDFGGKKSSDTISQSVTAADPSPNLACNPLNKNTLLNSPLVKSLLKKTHERSPKLIQFSIDKAKIRLDKHVSSVGSCDSQNVTINNRDSNVMSCLLSSVDEKNVSDSPSVCRDPLPSLSDTIETSSTSLDLGNIILEPPPGFDVSCHSEDSAHSSSNSSESIVPETGTETHQKLQAVSFTETESPDLISVKKSDKDRTYNLETTKNKDGKRKTFLVRNVDADLGCKLRRTTFVVPKDVNSVTASKLNTQDCKRRTFVVPLDQISSNTLIIQANESREMLPSPGMSDVSFGDLALPSKDVEGTFIVDKNKSDNFRSSTGQLALSSSDMESPRSVKCARSTSERSEEGSDASSTPSTGKGASDANYVPRGRQLYRTPATGSGKSNSGPEHIVDSSIEIEDTVDNRVITNKNKQTMERLSSANDYSAETEVDIDSEEKQLEDDRDECNIMDKSGGDEDMIEVQSRKKSSLDSNKTFSNESLIKPVKLDLSMNETYVKATPIGKNETTENIIVSDSGIDRTPVDVNYRANNVMPDLEDSCTLDDSGNIFAPVKNKRVKRNLSEEKRSRDAGAKRSRKDSIEQLLIKQLNEEYLSTAPNSENQSAGKDASQSKPNRGRKKKTVPAKTNKKVGSSAVNNTKAKQTDCLGTTDVHKNESEEEMSSEEKMSTLFVARGDQTVDEIIKQPRRAKKTLNTAPDDNEMFDGSKNKNASLQTNLAYTSSKKDAGKQSNASNKTDSRTKRAIKKSSCEGIITAPLKSSDDVNELADDGARRSRRQRAVKKVDYREVTPTGLGTKGKTRKVTKRSDTLIENILDSPSSSRLVSESTTASKKKLKYPNDALEDNTETFSDIIDDVSEDSNSIISKQPSQRGRARGRGAKNNAPTKGRGQKRNVIKVPELVTPEGKLSKKATISSALRDGVVTSRSRGKRVAASVQTPKQEDVDILPTTSILEAPALGRGSKAKRGQNAAQRGNGRTLKSTIAKGELHEDVFDKNSDIDENIAESALENQNFSEEKSTTAKRVASGRASARAEVVLEAPALGRGSKAKRGQNAAQRGNGRTLKSTSAKGELHEDVFDKNSDIDENIAESALENQNFSEEKSKTAKRVASGRASARAEVVKNKRGTKRVKERNSKLSLSPMLQVNSQNVEEEHTKSDTVQERRSRRGKISHVDQAKEPEVIADDEINNLNIQKKRAAATSKTKAAKKVKVSFVKKQ